MIQYVPHLVIRRETFFFLIRHMYRRHHCRHSHHQLTTLNGHGLGNADRIIVAMDMLPLPFTHHSSSHTLHNCSEALPSLYLAR